jgi:cytochrome c oxidase subunit 2
LGLTLLVACGKASPSIVDPHGSEARRIAGVWWLMFGLAAAVYVIVAGFIIVALVRGRGTESGRPSRVGEDAFIWVGGVIAPVAILAVLATVTVTTTGALRNPHKGELHIEVVGKRWWWDVSYPDQHFKTANEIHIPVGRPVAIGLDSDNVIHSFWVPQLAGKMDQIPGQHNVLRFTAEKAGTYRGQCAEYCGLEHARMSFLVIADPPGIFDRWLLRHQRVPSPPDNDLAAKGELVFLRSPCAGCHTIRGTAAQGTVGPDLTDFGSRHWIGSLTVQNTRANLSGWIADSQSIKPGNLMPPISLEPGDLDAVVAYLESLT